jgi:hypothetical protein
VLIALLQNAYFCLFSPSKSVFGRVADLARRLWHRIIGCFSLNDDEYSEIIHGCITCRGRWTPRKLCSRLLWPYTFIKHSEEAAKQNLSKRFCCQLVHHRLPSKKRSKEATNVKGLAADQQNCGNNDCVTKEWTNVWVHQQHSWNRGGLHGAPFQRV